ncbi:YlbF family regulator [Ornithinibacillus gellani]|uniref:YlbF family regulator n=1 Tax=Ornithinibacillus gellani TaxID=2293253 RepID=UPI000F49C03E|nr:YlbF family regulator [Ornithinibacillus gellani]TQS75672.1 YlbF family regulator [Ornithinibacillus gellani]
MIATLEYADILDRSEQLGEMIVQSDDMEQFMLARKALEEDEESQRLIRAFTNIKEHYEDVQRFGRYHPDYRDIMKNVRAAKREMDMDDKVAAFKIAERNLQRLLDEVSELIAFSVSEQIMVPKDGAALTDGGCGCGSGGSCGCKAS